MIVFPCLLPKCGKIFNQSGCSLNRPKWNFWSALSLIMTAMVTSEPAWLSPDKMCLNFVSLLMSRLMSSCGVCFLMKRSGLNLFFFFFFFKWMTQENVKQQTAASWAWLFVMFCTVVTWCVEVVVWALMHVELNHSRDSSLFCFFNWRTVCVILGTVVFVCTLYIDLFHVQRCPLLWVSRS